jgi:Holliday junction DNA helicase RuvA
MIAHLRGRLAAVGEDHLVVDVGGVGYLVQAGARTLQRLPRIGEAVELVIETQLRPEQIALYGFIDPAERSWFRLLQTVQGVGAKVALALVGTLSPEELATAVASRDKATLARAPGVGSRLAGRLVAELADRVGELPRPATPAPAPAVPAGEPTPTDDALAALLRLGFARAEAFAALARARSRLGAEAPLEALVREGLKELAAP